MWVCAMVAHFLQSLWRVNHFSLIVLICLTVAAAFSCSVRNFKLSLTRLHVTSCSLLLYRWLRARSSNCATAWMLHAALKFLPPKLLACTLWVHPHPSLQNLRRKQLDFLTMMHSEQPQTQFPNESLFPLTPFEHSIGCFSFSGYHGLPHFPPKWPTEFYLQHSESSPTHRYKCLP